MLRKIPALIHVMYRRSWNKSIHKSTTHFACGCCWSILLFFSVSQDMPAMACQMWMLPWCKHHARKKIKGSIGESAAAAERNEIWKDWDFETARQYCGCLAEFVQGFAPRNIPMDLGLLFSYIVPILEAGKKKLALRAALSSLHLLSLMLPQIPIYSCN